MSNDNLTSKMNYAIHPGEILSDTLEEYKLTQKELAARTGVTPKHINEIIKGKASITSAFAQKLAFVFNTSSSFWLGLQKNYEEVVARLSVKTQFESERSLLAHFTCYPELVKLNMVKATRNLEERYTELLSFFRVSSLELVSGNYSVQFRKTDKELNKQSMSAWLRMGEIQYNRAKLANEYNEQKFKASLAEIRGLTALPIDQASARLEQICSEVGIFVAFTPYLKNTYVNGATRWINSTTPLIQLTARTARSDAFWFTFFHEAAHILRHSKKNSYIEWESDEGCAEDEKDADQFAADILIPKKFYENFTMQGDYSPLAIKSFSGQMGIGQDIVAGRLARDGLISWPFAQGFVTKIKVTSDAI